MLDGVFNQAICTMAGCCRSGLTLNIIIGLWLINGHLKKEGKMQEREYYSFAFSDNMPKLNTNNKELRITF